MGQENYVPQIEAHSNYVPHVPHFEAQNEVHSNYVTHVPHFEVQNRGSGAQNQKLPLNISKLEYYGAFW